jgi:ElaB/YqjD/DUF883 family membrane-anchored ribosome-binding protein
MNFAERLRNTADLLEQKAASKEGQVAQYLNQASAWFDCTADYIQQFNSEQVKASVEEQVRRNPGRSLLIAGAVGLLIGLLVRR